ncbi:hypothetical protein ACQUWL_18150 [Serratia marcescens]|uniref:hypothetical protein n=1 Tax=Serratia marcescens TaxID=615 RepID=UPI003D16C3BC
MSLTIGLSFAWLNLLDLYNNDTLFFQKLTISVINNTSFADVVASYLRLILYLPFGLLAIVLTLLFCARRLWWMRCIWCCGWARWARRRRQRITGDEDRRPVKGAFAP